MNPAPEQPELDRLSADMASLLGRIGLDPAERPERRHRIDLRFAAVAARYPGRVAARDAEDEATYLDLELFADDLARRLSGRTGAGRAVAVRAGRTCAAPGAVLGVLRSGAAVLPLDPGHHPGLQEFLMRDAGASLVVSDSGLLRDEIPVAKVGRFVIGARPAAVPAREIPVESAFMALPGAGTDPGRAARVRPLSHLDVLSWVDATVPLLEVGPDDVWTLFHALSLDLGMREMWGPLLSGARAEVVDRATAADPFAFAALLADRRVTVLTQLPSAFARLVPAAHGTRLDSLRHVLLSHEAVDPALVAAWRSAAVAPAAVVREVTGSPRVW
ncbi:AMP-binding protein [Streptomyces sp. NPDC004111]|uniref:AMP-binding protein n=1 Tax=Streptomyces sp. NPDC004111 TaxID=3364690 RepID=UPI00369D0E43